MNLCSVEGCYNKVLARSLCANHYQRLWKKGRIEEASLKIVRRIGHCQLPGCTNPIAYNGFCNVHNKRLKIHGDPDANFTLRKQEGPCSVIGCGKPIETGHYCRIHYLRVLKTGSTERRIAEAGNWRVDARGYLVGTRNGRRVYQHRYVVELALGKPLRWGQEVHHLNGDKTDNRPWNLVVCPDRDYHVLIAARQRQFGYAGLPRVNKVSS
jgi:hypothetical protein